MQKHATLQEWTIGRQYEDKNSEWQRPAIAMWTFSPGTAMTARHCTAWHATCSDDGPCCFKAANTTGKPPFSSNSAWFLAWCRQSDAMAMQPLYCTELSSGCFSMKPTIADTPDRRWARSRVGVPGTSELSKHRETLNLDCTVINYHNGLTTIWPR